MTDDFPLSGLHVPLGVHVPLGTDVVAPSRARGGCFLVRTVSPLLCWVPIPNPLSRPALPQVPGFLEVTAGDPLRHPPPKSC